MQGRWDILGYFPVASAASTTYTPLLLLLRHIYYLWKVMGQAELADNPIYQEARRRGGKVIRDMHRPPEGGDT
eukprot:6214416-Pleurochrysis_carterae.AAC.1